MEGMTRDQKKQQLIEAAKRSLLLGFDYFTFDGRKFKIIRE